MLENTSPSLNSLLTINTEKVHVMPLARRADAQKLSQGTAEPERESINNHIRSKPQCTGNNPDQIQTETLLKKRVQQVTPSPLLLNSEI